MITANPEQDHSPMEPLDQTTLNKSSFLLTFEPPGQPARIMIDLDNDSDAVDISCYVPYDLEPRQILKYLDTSIKVAKYAISEITND